MRTQPRQEAPVRRHRRQPAVDKRPRVHPSLSRRNCTTAGKEDRNDKKDIGLKRGETKVDALNYGGGATLTEEEHEALSKIIEDLNTRFNTSFTEDEIMVIKQLEKKIREEASAVCVLSWQ